MTPQQAFQLVENATALLQLTRAEHFKIIQALEVLKKELQPKKEEERKE
jgi:hypothetical protein